MYEGLDWEDHDSQFDAHYNGSRVSNADVGHVVRVYVVRSEPLDLTTGEAKVRILGLC